jgi:hypothetical protein
MGLKETLRSLFFGNQDGDVDVEQRTLNARRSLSTWAMSDEQNPKTPITNEEIEMRNAWQKQVKRATKQYKYDSVAASAQMVEVQRNIETISKLTPSERMRNIFKNNENN